MYTLKKFSFNKRLTQFRKARGMSLEELGNRIEKSKGTVSRYENGTIIPDICTILKICNALNITISQLFPTVQQSNKKNSFNPFDKNKLFLYYYSKKRLIVSVIEVFEDDDSLKAKLFNGVKSIHSYANLYLYNYDRSY